MSETQMGAPSWEAWYFNCFSAEILRYCMGSGRRTWSVTIAQVTNQLNQLDSASCFKVIQWDMIKFWWPENQLLAHCKKIHTQETRNLSMKQGSLFVLFCTYEIHRTGMLQIGFLVSLESSTRRGAWAWFHDVWTCSAKVLEYWMISSLKIKLNSSWKFRRNWNVPLVFLERSWWRGNTWANGTRHTSIDEINFQNLLLESPKKKKEKSIRVNADFDFAAQLETLHVGQLHVLNITILNP